MTKGLKLQRTAPRALSERVDWNLMKVFQVIAEELSISKAAVRLHLSQPAVSQALKRLEEQVQTALIERSGPKFELTQAGVETLSIAKEVQGQFMKLDAALEASSEQIIGRVRLLAINGIRSAAYDAALAAIHQKYPGIDIEICIQPNDAILSALSQRTATFALAISSVPYQWLGQQRMTREHYRFYCGPSHRLFGRQDISAEMLVEEPVILFTSDLLGGSLGPLAEFRQRHGWRGPVRGCSADSQEVKRLVVAGHGIGCLPHPVYEMDKDHLWPLPPETVGTVDISLLWNQDQRLSRAESQFLKTLQEHAIEHDQPQQYQPEQ